MQYSIPYSKVKIPGFMHVVNGFYYAAGEIFVYSIVLKGDNILTGITKCCKGSEEDDGIIEI